MKRASTITLCVALAVGTFASCSANDGGKNQLGPGGGSGGIDASAAAGGTAGNLAVGGSVGSGAVGVGGGLLDAGAGGSGAVAPDGACQGVSQQAEEAFQPADIIWAIDTSGSMLEEAQAVQVNINDFSKQIVASGIDAHVVMIAGYPVCFPPPFPLCLPGICVGAPLGSGVCPPQGPDTKAPDFFHHPTAIVESVDAARKLVETFNDYKHMLRPQALKYLVVVTDDDSRGADGSSGDPGKYDGNADLFISDYKNLDPTLSDGAGNPTWSLSAIYSFTSCLNAANVGTVWKEIVDKTGGVHGDICSCPPGQPAPCAQTFQQIFNELATKISQGAKPLDCQWAIPPPPPGQNLDPAKVNVEFIDQTQGTKETIYHVADPSQCDPALGGWYYDDNVSPTTVIVCPQTCTKIKGVLTARMDILFGCETQNIPR